MSVDLGAHIATFVVSLMVGLLLREFQWRARVVWWAPHVFLFDVPVSGTSQPVRILTHAITLQNIGRKAAEDVEIIMNVRPDSYKLQPSLNYQEGTTPAGDFVIKIPKLGPKEMTTLQILSHTRAPELQTIRSSAGMARQIRVTFARQFPQYVYKLLFILIMVGFGFIVYWIIQAIVFISSNIPL